MDTDHEFATDADTLLSVIDEAKQQGYEVQQIARTSGIECTRCGNTSDPAAMHVDHVRRLEGASDAADMMMVLWSPCPACGARGVLVLGYGPNASEEDTAVSERLDLSGADPSPTDDTDGADPVEAG